MNRFTGVVVLGCWMGWLPGARAESSPAAGVDFSAADQAAIQAPADASKSLQSLAEYFKQNAKSDLMKTRIICRWMAENIAYDVDEWKAIREKPQGKSLRQPEEVLNSRKAVCGGYAAFFYTMAQLTGLKAVCITGYSKDYNYVPGQPVTNNTRHAWNAVMMGGRWWPIDPTWASGYVDDSGKFVKEFNEFYFFPVPTDLILSHFPAEPAQQFLPKPITLPEFESQVEIMPHFFRMGLMIDSHRQALINAGSDVEVTLKSNSRTVLTARLMQDKKELADEYVFIQNPSGQTQVNAVFPAAGNYQLDIFAKRKGEKGDYHLVVRYHVAAVSGKSGRIGFPKTFACFHERNAKLYSPMDYYVKAGVPVAFKIRVPEATRVAVVQKDKWEYLSRGLIFEGKAKLSPGKFKVYALFPGNKDYEGVTEHEAY